MKYVLLLVAIITIQSCSSTPQKKDMKIIISEAQRYDSITFTSSSGSFGYWCDRFAESSPKEKTTFSPFEYQLSSKKNIKGANIYGPSGKEIDIEHQSSLYTLATINSLSVDWKGSEKFMPQYIFYYNNNLVNTFINNCESSFNTDKQAYFNKIETQQKAEENRANNIKELIAEKIQKSNYKKVLNGGELILSNTLVHGRLSGQGDRYRFLENKNTAYYMDFSSYIVTQQINNSTYMLRNLIDIHGLAAQAHIELLPIIFHSKKQLFEQSDVKATIVIYKGVQTYKNIYGQNKQAVVITEL